MELRNGFVPSLVRKLQIFAAAPRQSAALFCCKASGALTSHRYGLMAVRAEREISRSALFVHADKFESDRKESRFDVNRD